MTTTVRSAKAPNVMCKAYHNELSTSLQTTFKRCILTHGTRQKDTFQCHRVRTTENNQCVFILTE